MKSGRDGVDLDFGERLAVAIFHAVAFTAFLFEDDNFVALQVCDNAGFYAGAADVRCADGNFISVGQEMNVAKCEGIALLRCQPVDEDLLTFLNFKLLTGDGNNCEHIENQKIR